MLLQRKLKERLFPDLNWHDLALMRCEECFVWCACGTVESFLLLQTKLVGETAREIPLFDFNFTGPAASLKPHYVGILFFSL